MQQMTKLLISLAFTKKPLEQNPEQVALQNSTEKISAFFGYQCLKLVLLLTRGKKKVTLPRRV